MRNAIVITRAPMKILLAICLGVSIRLFAAPGLHPSPQPRNPQAADSASSTFTVADLQRVLAAEKGKSDRDIARKLSHLRLTERMSDATLATLRKELPGPKSQLALLALADTSAFLPPSPQEALSQPPPALTEQRHIIASAVDYVNKTVPRLPDLFANETIIRFRADPQKKRSQEPSSWRQIDTSNAIVSYRNGKEVVEYLGWINMPLSQKSRGLRVTGVFGPILFTVLTDAAQGYMNWDHWERGKKGLIAVFHYQITRDQSQYAIGYYLAPGGNGMRKQLTAYHGQIGIDPATGAILRLTVLADPPIGSSVLESNILVEYGPVEIGGKPYICPLKSISLSIDAAKLPDRPTMSGANSPKPQGPAGARWLNETTFANYHLFRSQMQIITGGNPAPPQ